MQKPENNILAKMSSEDYKRSRKIMVDCVLETDMQKHFEELSKFKSRLGADDFDISQKDKDIALKFLFHLADISNATKSFDTCQKWTELLFVEFFDQGDQERDKGLQINYLMDRTTINIAKSQIGFIDYIIYPAYEAAS